ncbi:toxin [Pseudomonas sp. GD04058]|uniref:RHS repeat-associated core domain-containing protein n=1 Tax=Pseudomonas sp. GD04058 TaxID=2975429 RepID=UPI0024475D40|nr:RHS repeat-associated core domain-containing protein [Pseudomonas sp. GD04058]MDG9882778.1 toxin [Pseudomonas sp. GD04058]
MSSSRQLHQHTPVLSVGDSRGATVRSVAYCRVAAQEVAERRVTAHAFDVLGRDIAACDPRVWNSGGPPNRTQLHSLSGRVLFTESRDAGWRLALSTEVGPAAQAWDSRGSVFRSEYDGQLRPVALHEQAAGEASRVIERLAYGGADLQARNQCGRLLRHDDPAGTVLFDDYALGGQLRRQRRRFLVEAEGPDWPGAESARDALLEPGDGYATETHFNPPGDPVLRIDALGNRQRLALDQAGALRSSTVQLAGSEQAQRVRDAIHYDAMGRVSGETAGNGVVTERSFCPKDGRLQRQLSRLPGQAALQDLRYQYDPAGNILVIDDLSQPLTFYRNQRIAAQQVMVYDTLYQLIEARGVEVDQPSHGPGLPPPYDLPLDPTRLVNYVQRFEYDAAGNLLSRQHSNAAGLRMAVSGTSNHALPGRPDGSLPDEAQIAAAHDGCGNLLRLEGIAEMHWNPRNQLAGVRQVTRDSGSDDHERYIYSADGNRVRKVSVAQARSRSLDSEVRYLPGLELHRAVTGDTRRVVLVDEHLRISGEQWRYSLGDHLGSIAVELDGQGALLSREAFYPFGGTAVWAARSVVRNEPKTHRYCGKERDAGGLYYFGLRYYAPWLGRWISADPLGEVDGLNLYRMVMNNPLNLRDVNGGEGIPTLAHTFWAGKPIPADFLQNTLMFKYHNPDWQVNLWTPTTKHWRRTLEAIEDDGTPVQRYLAHHYADKIQYRDPEEMFAALAGIYPQAYKVRSIYAREGNGPFSNLASMGDVFRLGALEVYGGLWMDGDVAVRGPIDLSKLRGDFYMYSSARDVMNVVLAAEAESETGRCLLDQLVLEYSPQSLRARTRPEVSWVEKRSGPAALERFSRFELTMAMTGPTMIGNVLGFSRVIEDFGVLPIKPFYYRDTTPTEEVSLNRSLEDVLYSDYRIGVNASANWSHIRAGRRASIG